MPPKGKKTPNRSKSPKKSDNSVPEVSYFAAPLNENWNSLIACVIPSNEYDELYLEQLERSVKNGLRRRFTWFSKKDITDLILENSSSTKSKTAVTKPKTVIPIPNQLMAIIEQAKVFVENKEEIPDQLMAQLVKGRLMMIKQIEMEKEEKRKARKRGEHESRGGAATAGKAKSPTGKKSPTKAAKKTTGPAGSDAVKQSNLKKKEEEDDEKFLDDEPEDGPDHFILMSGFYSPTLFNYLEEFQIPVDCIIKFKSPNTDVIINFLAEIESREKVETNLKTNLKISIDIDDKQMVNVNGISKEKEEKLVKVRTELDTFWKEINQILEEAIDGKLLLQDVARLKFNVQKDPAIKSWFETELRTEFADNLFHSIAEKLFGLVVQKRQFKFYIDNLKLFSIPDSMPLFTFPAKEPVTAVANSLIATSRVDKTTVTTTHRDNIDLNASINTMDGKFMPEADKTYDIRYYNELMDSVPAEYISSSIMLHCMVEQVVATDEKKPLPSETNIDSTIPQIANFNTDICKHLSNMVNGLGLEEKDVKSLANMLPKQKKEDAQKAKTSANTPFLVNINDEVGNRLKGVFEDNSQKKVKKAPNLPFDPLTVEYEMLKKSMFTVFTGLPYIPAKLSKERAARLQELLHFCSSPEISNADVDRSFKLFCFETMNLTDVNRKNTIRKNERNLVIPWDDPYPNINATLTEDQQIFLKNLNLMEAKKELKEEIKKKHSENQNRVSSASTGKSIKFNDIDKDNSSSGLSSILKSRPSTRMSDGQMTPIPAVENFIEFVQSVHFPDNYDQNQNEIDVVAPRTIDQTMEMISSTKKRDLNDWNIAEHYEPRILVQKLSKVSYTHPYVDSYYNRRDNSLMLVFSNPFDDTALTNNEEFRIKLHSDVGFRNYLEKISDMIVDWTRDEEAKYQASLVARDVDKYRSESVLENDANTTFLAASSPRSKSSKKAATTDQKTITNTVETTEAPQADYITDNFVGHVSLKAWKMEQDKQREAADLAEAVEKAKKVKSPKAGSKMTNRPKTSSKSPPKSPNGKSSPKAGSRAGSAKKGSRSPNSQATDEKKIDPKIQKANNAFVGYNVGNRMVYVKSYSNHMFPCNGSLVKTERHLMKTSNTNFVTTTLVRDGHTFSMHVIDPMTPDEYRVMKKEQNKPKKEEVSAAAVSATTAAINTSVLKDKKASATPANRQSKISMIEATSTIPENIMDQSSFHHQAEEEDVEIPIAKYSCFTGVFQDGLSLSFSNEKLKLKPKKPLEPETPRTAVEQSMANVEKEVEEKGKKDRKPSSNKKSGVAKKKDSVPDLNASTGSQQHDIKEDPEPCFKILPWSQLFLSTPTGLSCTFLPETYNGVTATKDNEPHRLLVKQSYTSRSDDKAGEHFKNFNSNVLKEKSRIIKSDGSVVKFMIDSSIEIYYPNGTIYRKHEEAIQDDGEAEASGVMDTGRDKKKKEALKKGASDPEEPVGGSHEPKLKTKWVAITPTGNEYLINKQDKSKNEHVNFYRSIQGRDIQTGEVMLNREDHLKIIYRTDGSTLVEFEDGTRITTFYDQNEPTTDQGSDYNSTDMRKEKYLKIECPGFASTIFNSKTSECTLAFGTGTLVACDPKKMLYNVIYSSGDLLDINQDGLISFMSRGSMENSKNRYTFNQSSDEIFQHEDEEGNQFRVTKYGKSTTVPVQKRDVTSRAKNLIRQYQKHSPRFFIVHKDSSGTELLRYEDICEYMSEVEIDPMTAIIRDNVQGYPNVMGTTVLKPLKNCLTDTWICDYDEKDVTPPGLRCRNLYTFPPNPEIKVPGPKFGSNFGRGLHINVKPLQRVNNPQLKIAKRMEYRQLIEYQKLSDEMKTSLMSGLRNYMKYISERAENHRMLLTHDPRTELEKQTAIKVLQLARPDNLLRSDIKIMYGNALKRASLENVGKNLHVINKLIIKSNANKVEALKEEMAKEKVNKEAWRTKFVPAYFESEWGKLFLEKLEDGSSKEGGFLQTSENYFQPPVTQEQERPNPVHYSDRSDGSKVKTKALLPPISQQKTFDSSSVDKKENLVSSFQSFERYHPKFKHADKLSPNKLPNSIKTTRSNAMPNTKFFNIEEPVRRKTKNAIVNASQMNGKNLELRRGCEIFPNAVDFGILREGVTYASDFELFNVGIDSCRFKIKQPPAESGLKVIFKPGPIAAGMSRDISVVLLAIYCAPNESSEQITPRTREFKHNLEITTEADTIYIPIEAEVTTSDVHHSMFRGNLDAGKHQLARIISVRPTSTRDMITKQTNFLNLNSKSKNGSMCE